VIEGVSLVTNYRSQFSSVIKKNGMDTLIKRLAKKNKGKK
jgi:phospholipid transport system substrate-binding protein